MAHCVRRNGTRRWAATCIGPRVPGQDGTGAPSAAGIGILATWLWRYDPPPLRL